MGTAEIKEKRTPLDDLMRSSGATMGRFADWSLPLHFENGAVQEHRHCRKRASVFDVSHMTQIIAEGPDIGTALETLTPSGTSELAPGRSCYGVLTTQSGGIQDDLIFTNAGSHFILVANASRRESDLGHLRTHLPKITFTCLDDQALIALQGPDAGQVLSSRIPEAEGLMFLDSVPLAGVGSHARVWRSGYTGEDGFEISLSGEQARCWLADFLSRDSVEPAGLIARDSLRLEAGLSLYGQELDETISPIEAGLIWTIPKRRRGDLNCLGADRISREIISGPPRRLAGLRPEGRAIARSGAAIVSLSTDPVNMADPVGKVTSGGFSPTSGGPVALALINSTNVKKGNKVGVSIRRKAVISEVVSLPFVPHRYRRK